jgi:hypothetical protein
MRKGCKNTVRTARDVSSGDSEESWGEKGGGPSDRQDAIAVGDVADKAPAHDDGEEGELDYLGAWTYICQGR